MATALLVLLIATSGGYGWHRDELYFLAAGRHPAFGYADQPLFTPLVVAAADALGRGSLAVVRVASALAAALTAVVTGGIAAEMGGGRRARGLAAATWAVGGVSLVTGHFVDTTTFDVLAASILCWCVARAIRTGSCSWIGVAGVVVGMGLLNKLLVGFVAVFVLLGLLVAGPRSLLRRRPLLVAALAAALGAAPYLLWQAGHGWPQLALSRAIAANGAEGGRVGVVPFQLVLVAPVLVPVWVAGLVRLLRAGAGRPFRAFALAYGLLLLFVIATGGKAYYTGGLLPALVAAGGLAVDAWLTRGRPALRRPLLVAALVLSLGIDALIGLDLLTPGQLNGPVLALNPDAGEQVGWPQFTATVAAGWRQIPADDRRTAVIFTGNYGEAGAVDRYGPALGLPAAYSGHNGFADWGPPPDRPGPVLVVGYSLGQPLLAASFHDCHQVATVDNHLAVDNQERGTPVVLCAATSRPWSQLWPQLRHDN